VGFCPGLRISKKGCNGFQLFKDIQKFSDSINEAPYVVDKIFWAIGSRRFYLTDLKKVPNKKKGNKNDFFK
jgi:hypothetical protein